MRGRWTSVLLPRIEQRTPLSSLFNSPVSLVIMVCGLEPIACTHTLHNPFVPYRNVKVLFVPWICSKLWFVASFWMCFILPRWVLKACLYRLKRQKWNAVYITCWVYLGNMTHPKLLSWATWWSLLKSSTSRWKNIALEELLMSPRRFEWWGGGKIFQHRP